MNASTGIFPIGIRKTLFLSSFIANYIRACVCVREREFDC